jgi:branched-chain amino acid transport system substrate-binding protein
MPPVDSLSSSTSLNPATAAINRAPRASRGTGTDGGERRTVTDQRAKLARTTLAVLGAVGLVAAVSTGVVLATRSSETTASATTVDAPGVSGPAPAGPGVSVATSPASNPAPTTIEELRARWAANRADLVATLSAPGYGLGSDGILRGPGGFQLDLGSCPAGWSETEGVDATTIVVGHTTALTGNFAASARVTTGLQAYLDEVNTSGGVDGRQIRLVVKDDGFVPTTTSQQVSALLATDRPFLITTLGSPTTLAAYDAINAACVPHPFVISTHPAWGDPANHPWTVGLPMTPSTEAALWGAWIEQHLATDGPVTVAALVMDNELGQLYEQSFKSWADAHPGAVSTFTPVRHAPTASSVAAEMATVASDKPMVFLAMTAGRPCLQAIEEAATTGLNSGASALFLPAGCQDPATFLAPAGAAADGWRGLGGGLKNLADPRWADDPYLTWVRQAMTAHGLDPADPQAVAGFALYGWAQVEALRTAADLPGGLTRANLLLVLRSLNLEHPFSLDGIRLVTNGTTDAYPLEGSNVERFDAATQSWITDGGAPLDASGATQPCPWNGSSC